MKKWIIVVLLAILGVSIIIGVFSSMSAEKEMKNESVIAQNRGSEMGTEQFDKDATKAVKAQAEYLARPDKARELKEVIALIERSLLKVHGISEKETEKLLAEAGGIPNPKFREILYYRHGITTPPRWGDMPRFADQVPPGTTIEYFFELKPGETSQIFAGVGVWDITVQQADDTLSKDLDYVYDPDPVTKQGRMIRYRPTAEKPTRRLDESGEEVTDWPRATYAVSLPEGYAVPASGKVRMQVIKQRVRNSVTGY